MRKRDELADPRSCLNRARDDEWVFSLLGRDLATPGTLRFWVGERLRLGVSQPGAPELVDAEAQAREIAAEQAAAGRRAEPPDVYLLAGELAGMALRLSLAEWEEAAANPRLTATNRAVLAALVAFRRRLAELSGESPAPEVRQAQGGEARQAGGRAC